VTSQTVIVDTASQAKWNGMSLLMKPECPEFDRYRRYMVELDPKNTKNGLATDTRKVGIFMRALVTYNANLKDTTNVSTDAAPLASGVTLDQNYPNPCSGPAEVTYSLATATPVRLTIHDALGRELAVLAEGSSGPGAHSVTFDPRSFSIPPAAGLYMIRLVAGSEVRTRTMIMVK
jgi:hypothetical protein